MKILQLIIATSLFFGCTSYKFNKNPEIFVNNAVVDFKNCKSSNNEDISFMLRVLSEEMDSFQMYSDFESFAHDYFNILEQGGHIHVEYPISPSNCSVMLVERFSNEIYLFFKYELDSEYGFFVFNYRNLSIELINEINSIAFSRNSGFNEE